MEGFVFIEFADQLSGVWGQAYNTGADVIHMGRIAKNNGQDKFWGEIISGEKVFTSVEFMRIMRISCSVEKDKMIPGSVLCHFMGLWDLEGPCQVAVGV